MHKQTYSSVYGIDIDSVAINYAQEKYLETSFIQGDACLISDYFANEYFSFIYLFNVLYAIEDKFSLVKQLGQIARKDAILAIFDYTTENPSLELNDLAGKPMYPIVSSKLSNDLKNTGWEILEFQDLSSHFLLWYEDLLSKLENESFALSSRFSEEDILKVKVTFQTIKGLLSSSYLGGVVIFAKRKDDLKLL